MYRAGLMLVGLLALSLGVAGMVIAVSGVGVVHLVMEGLRGVFFSLCGIAMVTVGVMGDRDFARSFLRDLARDTFTRRNLAEFAAFWIVVGIVVWVMRLLRH